jgi:hypothetical protein
VHLVRHKYQDIRSGISSHVFSLAYGRITLPASLPSVVQLRLKPIMPLGAEKSSRISSSIGGQDFELGI